MVPPEATIHHGLAQRVRMFGEIDRVLLRHHSPNSVLAQAVYAISPYKLDSSSPMGVLYCVYTRRKMETGASYATYSRDTRALTGI